MMAKLNATWPLPGRNAMACDRFGPPPHRTAPPPKALRATERPARADEVILDLALCLILAATIITLLMLAL